MSEQSQLVASMQLADGREARKFRSEDGNVSYRVDGQFISPDVWDGLEQSPQSSYIVTPQTQDSRERAIRNRYSEYDNYQSLDPDNISASESSIRMSTKGWIANESLRKQVENDPLIQTRQEENRAIEARARELAKALDGVEGERRIKIMKDFDIY